MSYKTANSSVFPPMNKQAKSRMTQEYTAIQVNDPRHHEISRTPPQEQQHKRTASNNDRPNSKLDHLVSRQEQLLNHQIQVSNRQDELASHLANQNQAMNQALLKQVLSNKDSMISDLAQLQASDWNDHTRDLLTQHIKYIVAIVQRLNMDIEGLESELRGRDMAVIGTNKAVNKLEVHHVTMLQDLRGRIVRSESAIGKHTKDISMLMDEIRRLEGQQQQTREKMMNEIHRLEAEESWRAGELERQAGEQRSELSHMRSDALHRISMLEDKQKANMLEFHSALDGNKSNIDHYLTRMEAKFKAMIDKATSGWGDLMSQVDRQLDKSLMSILSRLADLEERSALDRNKLKQIQHNVETQVMATLQDTLSYNNAELTNAKLEFRRGFAELQDSLANMKRVVEGRRKILANQMKKELGQVKKAMYLELPNEPQSNTIVYRTVDKSKEW